MSYFIWQKCVTQNLLCLIHRVTPKYLNIVLSPFSTKIATISNPNTIIKLLLRAFIFKLLIASFKHTQHRLRPTAFSRLSQILLLN